MEPGELAGAVVEQAGTELGRLAGAGVGLARVEQAGVELGRSES